MEERKCARAFILNENNEILLEKFEFKKVIGNKVLWVTPGGGVKENETYEVALERELYEELGIKTSISSEPIFVKDVPIYGKEGEFVSHEVYYLIYLDSSIKFSLENMTESERDTFIDLKWWSVEELQDNINFAPNEMREIIKKHAR